MESCGISVIVIFISWKSNSLEDVKEFAKGHRAYELHSLTTVLSDSIKTPSCFDRNRCNRLIGAFHRKDPLFFVLDTRLDQGC